MGYRIGKLSRNKDLWRVLWRSEEGGVLKQRHVPAAEYARLGITKSMTIDEAKAILKKLNLEQVRTQREDRRNAIAIRMAEEQKIKCLHLPPIFVAKFETEHLATKYMGNETRLTKVLKLWRAAQRIIRAVKIPMEQWHKYPEHFYIAFEKQSMSPGYAKNILSILNMWVVYLGTEQEKHCIPVPAPKASWQARINTAFAESGNSKESAPITPEMLANASPPFSEPQHNWIYCSIWAGLRPNEVDALTNPKRTKVRHIDGTPILEVYQSKLKNVPNVKDRWKYIPLFLPEQQKILEIIASGKIDAPLPKTVASRFGEGHSLYGGRKGFHDLMMTRYQQIELEVVRWLGHRSLDMAMKHYAKKDAVRWVPFKKLG